MGLDDGRIWHYLPESRQALSPSIEHCAAVRAAGRCDVLLDQAAKLRLAFGANDVIVIDNALQLHELWVHTARKIPNLIQHICRARGHPCREVSANWPEDDHDTTGHVFAAVVAGALDNGLCAAISDGESLARSSCGE
jgi:hypothetical protein